MKIKFTCNTVTCVAARFLALLIFFAAVMNVQKASAQILSYTTASSGALNSVAANAFGDSLRRFNCVATTSSCSTGFTSNQFTDSTTYSPTRSAVQTWVAPDAGYTLNVDSFSANLRRSANGPDSAMFAYSTDGGNTWIVQGTDDAIPSVSCGAGTTFAWANSVTVSYPDTLRFRIYAFHANTTTGTEQILNLTISGTVTSNGSSCGTPSNLSTSNVTDSSATLNWGAVSGAASYNIEYKLSGAGSWSSATSPTNTLNITGLSASQTYEFKVQSVCSGSSGSYSDSVSFNTSAGNGGGGNGGGCDTLSNIASTDTITLYPYGTQVGYISGNNGYGDLAKAEEFTSVAGGQVTGALLMFAYATVLTTDSDSTIAVNVWNSNGAGNHPGTILATATLTLGTIANSVTNHSLIYVPFNPAATLTDTNFYVGVMLPAKVGDTVALYTNLKTSSDGRGWEEWKTGAWHPYDTAYSITPNHMGNYIEAIVCPAEQQSCGAPTSLSSGNVTDSSATLNWGAVAGAVSYNIQYHLSGASTWTTGTSNTNSLNITGLTGGETYEFEVQTVCSSGSSSFSDSANFITLTPVAGCGMTTNLNAINVTDSTATLTWDTVAGASGYHVQYSVAGSNIWITSTTPYDSITISGLTTGQTYQFEVQTVCSDTINANYSNAVSFSTSGGCSAPVGLSASNLTDSSATLKWGAVSGAAGYNIQYHTLGASTWNISNSTSDSLNLTGLLGSQTYVFEIQTICSGNTTSSYSDSATFTTFAGNNGGSCDSIINIATTDSLTLYPYGTKVGYISGNNGYADLAKAEEFTSIAGNQITGAILWFAYVTIAATDSATNVAINVWDDTGPGGHPGTVLATSSITLGAIANAVSGHARIYVPFNPAPTLVDSNFYIGVILPTGAGDTVALYTNLKTSGDGRGWEEWKSGVWHPYDSAYSLEPHQMGNYIEAISCPPAPPAPPVAAFTASPTNGCATLTVTFTDQSTNNPTSWNWTFTGGSPASSTLQSPVVSYPTPGNFSVTLVATNNAGSNSVTQTNYITVTPGIDITGVQTTPATGQTIANGSAIVMVSGGAQPYTYAWSNLETGDTDINMAPATYYVTVTDHNNCSATDSAVITAPNAISIVNTNGQLKIYPNPASDILHVEWNGNSELEMAIVDLAGKEITNFIINASTNINVHDLASGTYIIYIKNSDRQVQQAIKFTKL